VLKRKGRAVEPDNLHVIPIFDRNADKGAVWVGRSSARETGSLGAPSRPRPLLQMLGYQTRENERTDLIAERLEGRLRAPEIATTTLPACVAQQNPR
jgi:hypothetical protein